MPSPSSPASPSPKTKRATAPRGFVFLGGCSMSRRPAWDRCSTMRVPPSNAQTRYLARRVTESSRWPCRESGDGS